MEQPWLNKVFHLTKVLTRAYEKTQLRVRMIFQAREALFSR